MLLDTYETVALKARLDHDRAGPADHDDPRLVGRVARSTGEQALAALAAAREAQPAWARVRSITGWTSSAPSTACCGSGLRNSCRSSSPKGTRGR